MKFSHLALLAAILNSSDAFVVPTPKIYNAVATAPKFENNLPSTACFGKANDEVSHGNEERRPGKLRRLIRRTKRSLAFVALASSAVMGAMPQVAQASAPVMAMPKADARDPLTDALENHQRAMQVQAQNELLRVNAEARKVEAEQGPAAREKFEADYKANQEKMAQERLDGIKKLKNDLLDQGICPFTDMEGQRQVFKAEKGLDPAEVAGTRFYVEKEYAAKGSKQSYAYQKQAHREMIKAMVEDMKNRGMDPLDYFEKHQDKIAGILELPTAQAVTLANKYKANLEEYGQISPPKEGEMSVKEQLAKSGGKKDSTQKAEAQRLKAEAKAKAAAEKAATKEKARAEKEKAKAEAKAEKEAAKQEKEAAKAAAAAAASAAAAAVAPAEVAASAVSESIDGATSTSETETVIDEASIEGEGVGLEEAAKEEISVPSKKSSKGLPILPVSGVVVAVGGGGYALKLMRDKAAADEEERQRQLKLLMGGLGSDGSSAAELDEVDADVSDFSFEEEKSKPIEKSEEQEIVPKKKRRGMNVFGKKKNNREIDISALVSGDAQAPEFAKLLAKLLTFGAPGRFPGIIALPGAMPISEFDVETACNMLTEAQETAGLSKEEAAEVFANVVNCMLIDIVDLASASLKEKDEKVTSEAIGIVVDFMSHASSLYNSIAEGVVIKPVTYGGDLPKGKLEQMYTAYAASGVQNMMSMDEDFENRVALLQDVFEISDKKADGLMMKAMQKQLMEAMKSGKGLEGMEEMMKGMDLEGLAGMPGMEGEDMNPEQLKEMLREMKKLKDSGQIPEEQMREVKTQFKEAFGSTIDDVLKEADSEGGLGSDDKELLDLVKSVLYD